METIARVETHEQAWEVIHAIEEQVKKVVIGQDDLIRKILIGLIGRIPYSFKKGEGEMAGSGHILLEGVPGLAKTLLVSAVASTFHAKFSRIQFTPDMLPADILGTRIFDARTAEFRIETGPIFANIVLADEINRSSPRTQSALLEAMGEAQVSFDGVAHPLPEPFFVMATRNLAEAYGTFPLPQAQLDRFLLSFRIGYPSVGDEVEILERHKQGQAPLSPVLSATDILALQEHIYGVDVSRPVREYIAGIVDESRKSPELVMGVSPRGAVLLQKAAQGWAAMEDRDFVTPDDVKAVAHAVLLHRLVPRSSDPGAGLQSLNTILGSVPVPL